MDRHLRGGKLWRSRTKGLGHCLDAPGCVLGTATWMGPAGPNLEVQTPTSLLGLHGGPDVGCGCERGVWGRVCQLGSAHQPLGQAGGRGTFPLGTPGPGRERSGRVWGPDRLLGNSGRKWAGAPRVPSPARPQAARGGGAARGPRPDPDPDPHRIGSDRTGRRRTQVWPGPRARCRGAGARG